MQCHQSLLPLDLWQAECRLLPAWSVCLCSLIKGPRAYQRVMSQAPPDGLSGLLRREKESASWKGLEKRACPSGHKSTSKATSYLQRAGCPPKPWWFTAPTEARLGTATVSAPGPLSGGQDELFAEDIQMYKEQIRLTQSSFAPRDRKKRKRKGDRLTSKRPLSLGFLNEWKGRGNENSLVYSKC